MLWTAFFSGSFLLLWDLCHPQLLGSPYTTEPYNVSAGKGLRDPETFISLLRFRR